MRFQRGANGHHGCVGAGTRARHADNLGSRLGLPTGLLASLAKLVAEFADSYAEARR